ncbi:MAG TPA: hypothetical protein VFD32_23900, partial [Dehalococcoidia bacterium]|nr:hypothetical protein [Dehalococcoidia bacterium]
MMRALALLALCGCTNANLYSSTLEPNLPNKIGVQADICTDDPSNVAFPEKLLVVMDGTTQFVAVDPMASRASAVNNLIMRYQQNPNYSFGIIQYAGQATSETMGFPTDTAQVSMAVQQLQIGTTDGNRSYINALRAISAAVEDDILHSPPGLRSRTRYKIILVSYGPPNPDLQTSLCQALAIPVMDPMCQDAFLSNFCPTDQPAPADCEGLYYTRQVTALRSFALSQGAQDLEFHAIALGNDKRMTGLLNQMATAGHGTF